MEQALQEAIVQVQLQQVLMALAASSRSTMHSSTEALRGTPFLYSRLGSRQLRACSGSSLFRV